MDIAIGPGDKQWVQDVERKECLSCGCEFGLLTRKHHCRGCGEVFCSSCSSDIYDFSTGPDRVCFFCYSKRVTMSDLDKHAIDSYICKELDWSPLWAANVERRRRDKPSFRERKILLVGEYGIAFVKQADVKEKYQYGNRQHLIDLTTIFVGTHGKVYLEFKDHFGSKSSGCISYFVCAEPLPLVKILLEAKRQITVGFPGSVIVGMTEDTQLPLDPFTPGPVDGLIDTYKAYCQYYGVPIREELVTYVLDLVHSNIHEIDLTSCPGVDRIDSDRVRVDLRPMLSALAYNSYFNSVLLDEVRDDSVITSLGVAMLSNKSITKISISGLHNSSKGGMAIQALGEALAMNPTNGLQALHLSGVNLRFGRASERLFMGLQYLSHGLRSLVLRDCMLKPIHFKNLFHAFRNYGMSLTIEILDISLNELGEEGSADFGEWLQDCGARSPLTTLLIRKCSLSLKHIARHLSPLKNLDTLDLSGNSLKGTTLIQLLCQTLDRVHLSTLRIEQCELLAADVNDIFQTVIRNQHFHNLRLDLGDQPLLSSPGTSLFQKSSLDASNISSISLSHCRLPCDQFTNFLQNAIVIHNLQTLILDDSLDLSSGASAETAFHVSEDICNLLSVVRSINVLSMAHNFPAQVLSFLLISDIFVNSSIAELNISNNHNEKIIFAFAKFLRDNKNLLRVAIDKNNLTLHGLLSLSSSLLLYNSTLQYMSPGWEDYRAMVEGGKVYKKELEEVRKLLVGVQERLWGNRRRVIEEGKGGGGEGGLFESVLLKRNKFTEIEAPNEVIPLAPVPEHLRSKCVESRHSSQSDPLRDDEDPSPNSTLMSPPSPSVSASAILPSTSSSSSSSSDPPPPPPPSATSSITTAYHRAPAPAPPQAGSSSASTPCPPPPPPPSGNDKSSIPPPPPNVSASLPPPQRERERGGGEERQRVGGERGNLLSSIEQFKKDALKATEITDKGKSAFDAAGEGAEKGSLADLISGAMFARRTRIDTSATAMDDPDGEWD